MRSLILKSILAAVFASTALVGANAASHDHDRDHHGFHEFQPPDEADNSGYFDHMTMGPPSLYPAPYEAQRVIVAPRVVRHHVRYEPRLVRIEGEVKAANHRVGVDHARGWLSVAEARKFEARADGIRADAIRVADAHKGALPGARYAALQNRVQRLDEAIHHAAIT